jgi:outer membrane receptor protein involved in Fe transport
VTSNSSYAKYTPSTSNPVPPGLECSDYLINLDEMRRQGVELELDGHIFDSLSFYANYTYTALRSMGGEPAGKRAEDERAKHRVNAGLRCNLFKNTLLMLDYKFQDKQVVLNSEEVAEDEYIWYTVQMDKYHVFDFAIEQTLFKKYGFFKDVVAKFYIKNLFDEEYENSRGYPMTDRTYGTALSFKF